MLEIICNPIAGYGRGEKVGQSVAEALHQKGILFQLEHTQSPGHATQLARKAAVSGVSGVISIGGDGTAREVARGLIGTDIPLGIIPGGTGNDFIKALGLSKDPLSALDHILSHPALPTDVGEVNGKLFLNEIGTGFDVSVLDYSLQAKKYCRGILPYLYGVLRTMFHFSSIPITFTVDGGGEQTRDAFCIGLANGTTFGGGFPIAPGARLDDGQLDLVIINKIRRGDLISRLRGLIKGEVLNFPETEHLLGREFTFSTPGMRVNIDGEVVAADTVTARVLPGALKIRR